MHWNTHVFATKTNTCIKIYMYNCIVCYKLVHKHKRNRATSSPQSHSKTASRLCSLVRRIGNSGLSVRGSIPQRASCGASTQKSEAVAVAISHDAASTPPRLLRPFQVSHCPLNSPLALIVDKRCPTVERTALKPLEVTTV